MNFPFEPGEYAEVAEAYMANIPESEYPHLNALSQEVISGHHDGLHDFSFGLDLILDGLEQTLQGGGERLSAVAHSEGRV